MKILTLKYKLTNCYLIESNFGWIMIDTDWPDTLPQLHQSLKQQDIRTSDMKYLIVTHLHPDHAGLVQNLKDIGLKLILHEKQIPFVDKLNSFFRKNSKFIYKEIVLENNIIVSSEESRKFLRSAGIDGEIILTPGHSDDSISLIIDKYCAFTGDLPEFSLKEAYYDPTIKGSWKRILENNVKEIYPAHGSSYTLSKAGGRQESGTLYDIFSR